MPCACRDFKHDFVLELGDESWLVDVGYVNALEVETLVRVLGSLLRLEGVLLKLVFDGLVLSKALEGLLLLLPQVEVDSQLAVPGLAPGVNLPLLR